MKSAVAWLAVMAVLYAHAGATMVDARPAAGGETGEEDWETGWEGVVKADSHEHWEHIVRRSAQRLRGEELDDDDDTAHIVDVQKYYRDTFAEGWDEDKDHNERVNELLHQLGVARIQGGFTESEREHFSKEAARVLGMSEVTRPIQGRYIALFQRGTGDYVLDRTIEILHRANTESQNRLRADHISTIRSIRKGLVATLNSRAADLLRKHPLLDSLEVDTAVRRHSTQEEDDKDDAEAQSSVQWNLDRIDQHDLPLDGVYAPEGDGRNTDVYIIDTGVRATHQELAGRVHYAGFDAIDALTGTHGHGVDCNGHGTHCAATAAGTNYGVAKRAQIYNLRALDCSGTGAVSGIVQGIDMITHRYQSTNHGRRIVISQSLGVPRSESLNTAIQEATAAGIVMVGAAGNQGEDACNYSPPAAMVGISVGATDQHDRVVSFSNTGACMDVFAPGKDIRSASNQCDTCTRTLSGTSMATPHAAGYMAILLSLHPNLTPAQAKARLIEISTKNEVRLAAVATSLANATPNRLLYVPEGSAMDSDLGHAPHLGAASVQAIRDPR